MSFVDRLKKLFCREPSLVDQALGKCLITGDEALMYQFLMFYKSHTAVGTRLTLTEKDLPILDEILDTAAILPEERGTIFTGVAVYFGTLAIMTLGGKWTRSADGRYLIENLGADAACVDPFQIIPSVADSAGSSTLASEYAVLAKHVNEPSYKSSRM